MINETRFKGHVYWFGYEVPKEMLPVQRAEFIHYLKWTSERKMPDEELRNFIERPLIELDRMINIYSIECLFYPKSERSPLVGKMIETINDFLPRDVQRKYYELRKTNPADIGFDWNMFESEIVSGTNRYGQMASYVMEQLIPKIKNLEYFSMAESVKVKYRRYIKDFLIFSESDVDGLKRYNGKNILVVDDINTSGATLNEIIRMVRKINPDSKIYIYTLIRNHSSVQLETERLWDYNKGK